MATKTVNRASFAERLLIYELLKEPAILVKVPDSDLFEYVNEWDDDAVAQQATDKLGRKIGAASVANVRLEMFGRIKQKPKPATSLAAVTALIEGFGARLNTVERKFTDQSVFIANQTDHSQRLADLEARVKKIETEIIRLKSRNV